MDDGPWLYYKLTNEPKGSGELKIKMKRGKFREEEDEEAKKERRQNNDKENFCSITSSGTQK